MSIESIKVKRDPSINDDLIEYIPGFSPQAYVFHQDIVALVKGDILLKGSLYANPIIRRSKVGNTESWYMISRCGTMSHKFETPSKVPEDVRTAVQTFEGIFT